MSTSDLSVLNSRTDLAQGVARYRFPSPVCRPLTLSSAQWKMDGLPGKVRSIRKWSIS